MGSFLIGTGVTLVTFLYSADLWKHCDWADWVCRTGTDAACMFVSADLLQTYHGRYQDSAYRGGKREKVTVQLTVDQTMLFPAAKVRYRVRCRNTFAGYARNFWWNGAGLMRGMQCMEKRVVLSHVGSYEYELVKVRIYDLTGLFYVHKKIKEICRYTGAAGTGCCGSTGVGAGTQIFRRSGKLR